MPNWCENTLTITGRSKKSIAALKAKAERREEHDGKKEYTAFSLEQFIPTPPESFEKEFEGGAEGLVGVLNSKDKNRTDWYTWRLNNWGCKWDVDAVLDRDMPTELVYVFMSPWGPPNEAIETISKMYPKLEFTLDYGEPGMNFAGTMIWKNGELLENDEREYDYGEEVPLDN